MRNSHSTKQVSSFQEGTAVWGSFVYWVIGWLVL